MPRGPCRSSVLVLLSLSLAACTGNAKPEGEDTGRSSPATHVLSPHTCPAPPIPPGIYTKTIAPSDPGAAALAITGRWTVAFGGPNPNCLYAMWAVLRVGGQVAFVDAHPYTIGAKGMIVLHGAQEPPSPYRVTVRGDVLIFHAVPGTDGLARAGVLTINPWTLEEQA